MTAAAVFKVLDKGPEVNARNDISQLSNALGEFKTKFGDYPPSKIVLRRFASEYNNPPNQVDADSLSFLKKMYPRILDPVANGGVWTDPMKGIDWGAGSTPIFMEGQNCLVFFLGGAQTSAGNVNGCLGWGTDPHNPMNLTGGTLNGTPFYQFPAPRLRGSAGGFEFVDAWGRQPYLYFSSGKAKNNYSSPPLPGFPSGLRYGTSDCATYNVSPYYLSLSPSPRFHHEETYQIVAAGKDKLFGPGGQWTTASAFTMPINGRDDMTNFHGRLMGDK